MIEDRIVMIKVNGTGDLGFIITNSEDEIGAIFSSILIERVAILDRRFRATIIVAQLNVNNTSNRVCAVGRGGTVLQNFDAVDRRARDRKQIDKRKCAARADWVDREALAID